MQGRRSYIGGRLRKVRIRCGAFENGEVGEWDVRNEGKKLRRCTEIEGILGRTNKVGAFGNGDGESDRKDEGK